MIDRNIKETIRARGLILRDDGATERVSENNATRLRSNAGVLEISNDGGSFAPVARRSDLPIDVRNYGAVGDGVTDDSQAFIDAIAATSPGAANLYANSRGGLVYVPRPLVGYRFASNVSIKRSCRVMGEMGGDFLGSRIIPDPGITGFIIERYNTPDLDTLGAAGDFAVLEHLTVAPTAKATAWATSTSYALNTIRQAGTGTGEDWPRVYRCTTAGMSAASGTGPKSFGLDYDLAYDGQAGNFTVGLVVTGGTSGAYGTIIADTDAGATGSLRLTKVYGTFQNNEPITDTSTGAAVVNGVAMAATTDELDGTCRWEFVGTGAGFQLRACGFLNFCTAMSTTGAGIHIEAQDASLPTALANANAWGLLSPRAYNCNHGLYVNGSDANGGWCQGGFFNANVNYGIYESSFLANSYTGVQFQANGTGSIFHDCANPCVFSGCYTEGDSGNVVTCTSAPIIIGGTLAGADFQGAVSPILLTSGGNSIGLHSMVTAASEPAGHGIAYLGSADDSETFYGAQAAAERNVGYPHTYKYGSFGGLTGAYGWCHANTDRTGLMHAGGVTAVTANYAQPRPGTAMFKELYVGPNRHYTGSAAPTTGTWQVGDRIYDTAPVAGGTEGWVCTTAGTADAYAGVRTATTDGTTTVVLSGSAMTGETYYRELKAGDWITLDGGSALQIRTMSSTGLSIVVSSTVAGGAGRVIATSPPVFKTFGAIAP